MHLKMFIPGILKKICSGFSLRDVGPQDILHFKYKIAILCTLLLSATPINADDTN